MLKINTCVCGCTPKTNQVGPQQWINCPSCRKKTPACRLSDTDGMIKTWNLMNPIHSESK